MILRRLGIFFFILIFGIGVGVFLIDYVANQLDLPKGLADFIMVLYVGVFIIVSLIAGKDIPKETVGEEEDELPVLPSGRKKGKGKIYAWLNPFNDETRAGFPITKKLMTIGRDVNVDILISDDTVSKKHAQIMSLPGGFMLKDLDSKNGTFINNQRIEESYLSDGDVVTFGEVNYVFTCSKVKMELAETEVDFSDLEKEMDAYATRISTGTRFDSRSRLRETSFSKTRSRLREIPGGQTHTPGKDKEDSQGKQGTRIDLPGE